MKLFINHSLPEGGSRMIQLIADRPEAPFVAARKNAALIEGDCHFARFFESPHGLLVVQHNMTRENLSGSGWTQTYASPMKRAVVDEEGIMRVGYWEGNEAMKGEKVELKAWKTTNGLALQRVQLDPDRGFVLEGSIQLPQTGATDYPGLYLGSAGERKTVLRVTPKGTSQIGTVSEVNVWQMSFSTASTSKPPPSSMVCLDMTLPDFCWPEVKQTVLMARRLQPDVLFRERGIGAYGDYTTPENWGPAAFIKTSPSWVSYLLRTPNFNQVYYGIPPFANWKLNFWPNPSEPPLPTGRQALAKGRGNCPPL